MLELLWAAMSACAFIFISLRTIPVTHHPQGMSLIIMLSRLARLQLLSSHDPVSGSQVLGLLGHATTPAPRPFSYLTQGLLRTVLLPF